MLKNTNKNFGILCSVISLFLAYKFGSVATGFIVSACLCLFFVFFKPSVFSVPKNLWDQLGLILQKMTSPVILTLIYLVIFIPLGLILRMSRKNFVNLNTDSNLKTYWIAPEVESEKIISSMRNQF
jgi:hypothetical protein